MSQSCAGEGALTAEFVASPDLGQKEWREPRQYAAVTVMFAIHYFFDSEAALKQLLHNVVINLKPGASCWLRRTVAPGVWLAPETERGGGGKEGDKGELLRNVSSTSTLPAVLASTPCNRNLRRNDFASVSSKTAPPHLWLN